LKNESGLEVSTIGLLTGTYFPVQNPKPLHVQGGGKLRSKLSKLREMETDHEQYSLSERETNRRTANGKRLDKGTTCSRAECARRSIYSAEKGNSISVTTLGLIANALKVSPKELLLNESPQPSPNLFRLQLVIEADLDKLNQSHALESFVSLLRNLIPASGDIVLKDIRQGSIILTLELEEEDALELVAIMPNFADFARDALRESIEQHIRRTPDFLEQLSRAISRRPNGRYIAERKSRRNLRSDTLSGTPNRPIAIN
jgi:transcriptional regulator with XRE-family HTH domain